MSTWNGFEPKLRAKPLNKMKTLPNGHRLGTAPFVGDEEEPFMPTDAHAIVQAIKTLGENQKEWMNDLSKRMVELETSVKLITIQQAEDRGKDVNTRLHDHEIRMRKLEQFKFWLAGAGAAAGFLGGWLSSWIKH